MELPGQFVAEPGHTADPCAIAVHVQGVRIGYLPSYLARQVQLSANDMLPCQVQLWGAPDRGSLRVIGWAAYGHGPSKWPHTPANPPAVTIAEQRQARAATTTQIVTDALAEGDSIRAAQFRRGMVGGLHHLEIVEPIKQLKREGRLEEALALCYQAIQAAERDRGNREPAPWYTEQAAIIHRKRGERQQEIAVLRRWLQHSPPDRRANSSVAQRLATLEGKR